MEVKKKTVRILVVDDEEIIRDMLFDTLTQAGYTVKTAKDGSDAIAQIGNESFDIVITDIKMPDIGGMELLIRVRRTNPNVCVLLMTAYGTIKSAINAIKLGAHDYICKPFELSKMKNIVEKAANQKGLL
jgi:DNA-binding NtrC family response regulator